MTNKEKFVEAFGYSGDIVVKMTEPYRVCGHWVSGSCGYDACLECCPSRNYPRCPMWWKDEYKEEKNSDGTKD